ncbi:MAG: hypothetical protein IJ493_01555 [Clostridia bacterium]|nr:hypothetical protein [Clostridia bacterium]
MGRTYLNLLDLATGREIRAASLGFDADSPSFDGDGILLRRHDGAILRLSLETGMLSPAGVPLPPPDPSCPVTLRESTTIPSSGAIRYLELVLDGRILCRFMGQEGSLGARPLSSDGKTVVFCGYPTAGEDWGQTPD